jgi:hypothetical protein
MPHTCARSRPTVPPSSDRSVSLAALALGPLARALGEDRCDVYLVREVLRLAPSLADLHVYVLSQAPDELATQSLFATPRRLLGRLFALQVRDVAPSSARDATVASVLHPAPV